MVVGGEWIGRNSYDSVHSPIREAAAICRERERADTSSGVAKLLVIKQLQRPIRNAPKLNLALSSHSQVVTIRCKRESLVLIRQASDLHPVRPAINAYRIGGDGEERSVRRESGEPANGKSANKGAIGNVPNCG